MSESDVYRCQILTYKDGSRTERVNIGAALRNQINVACHLSWAISIFSIHAQIYNRLSSHTDHTHKKGSILKHEVQLL